MTRHGESIDGCKAADLPKPEWGRFTAKGDKLYAHIFDKPLGAIPLPGLKGNVEAARRLCDGSEMTIETPWGLSIFPDYEFINYGHAESTYRIGDPIDEAIELRLKKA